MLGYWLHHCYNSQVAWAGITGEKALYGYALDERAMHGYIIINAVAHLAALSVVGQ